MNFKDKGSVYRYVAGNMISDSVRLKNKNNYILLIKTVFDNRFADCEVFDKKLEEFFGTRNFRKKLNDMIEEIRKHHNADKAKILKEIQTYQFSKKLNIEPAKTEFEEKLKSYPEIVYNITATRKTETSLTKKYRDFNKQLHNDMKTFLNSDKSLEELESTGDIVTKDMMEKIKKHASEFSNEDLINAIIKNSNVEKVSEEELDQYIEVLQFFVNNIKLNITKLLSYEFDEIKMRNFYVEGEENLSKSIRDYSTKLFAWKLKKLQSILRFYEEMLNLYCDFKENLNLEDIKTSFDLQTRKYIMKDALFIYEYYKNLQSIKKVYNKIKNLNVNDSKIKELEEDYKIFVLGNNK